MGIGDGGTVRGGSTAAGIRLEEVSLALATLAKMDSRLTTCDAVDPSQPGKWAKSPPLHGREAEQRSWRHPRWSHEGGRSSKQNIELHGP
jgi:hypothetical protein